MGSSGVQKRPEVQLSPFFFFSLKYSEQDILQMETGTTIRVCTDKILDMIIYTLLGTDGNLHERYWEIAPFTVSKNP